MQGTPIGALLLGMGIAAMPITIYAMYRDWDVDAFASPSSSS
jgi:hypothetical protein